MDKAKAVKMAKGDHENSVVKQAPYIGVALAPHLFWGGIFVAIFLIIGPDDFRDLLSRTTKFSLPGVEWESLAEADSASKTTIELGPVVREQLKQRFERLMPVVSSARVLWADDNPPNNRFLIEFLNGLGVTIDLARSEKETEQKLDGAVYDVVISDMTRYDEYGNKLVDGGLRSLEHASDSLLRPPVIFYTGQQRATPLGALGLTNRPDVLLNLFLDAIEPGRI